MTDLNNHGFDKCQAPICSSNTSIEITSWAIGAGGLLVVEWNISGGATQPSSPSFNDLLWSFNNTTFNNSVTTTSRANPYQASVDITNEEGIIYLKAKTRIGVAIIESEVVSLDLSVIQPSTDIVKASICDDFSSNVPFDLYVRRSSITRVPFYFKYANLCWVVEQSNLDSSIPYDESVGIILEYPPDYFQTCNACTISETCPTEWQDVGTDDRVATFYIEYTTYTIRDNIIVYTEFDEDTCTGTELWSSGCAGTCRDESNTKYPSDCNLYFCEDGGEGKGVYINDYLGIPSDKSCVKSDCFTVFESQLPLGVEVAPNCENTSGTAWCVYIKGPEGYEYNVCGRDDGVCGVQAAYYCINDLAESGDPWCSTEKPGSGEMIIDSYSTEAACAAGCVSDVSGVGKGLFGGGSNADGVISSIEYVIMPTETSTAGFGNLYVTRMELGACSSSTRGLFAGGLETGWYDVIDYVTIATSGDAQDFANLTQWRYGPSGCSSSTRGLFAGDLLSITYVIDWVTISTQNDAQDFGDLTVRRYGMAACSSSTRGLFAGGTTGGVIQNVIDYVIIATTGDATDFGNLYGIRAALGACSSSTRGVFAGGYYHSGYSNIIDYVTIATTGNAIDFGDLTTTFSGHSSCSSLTVGLFAGGYPRSYTKDIDYVTIATENDATHFGDLIIFRQSAAGLSDAHGGLG